MDALLRAKGRGEQLQPVAIKSEMIVASFFKEHMQRRRPSDSLLVRLVAGLLFIRVSVYLVRRTIGRSRSDS